MEIVEFREMKHGSRADYELLDRYERQYIEALPDRVLATLRTLDDSLGGYRVSRLGHSLQTATRAENDGADEELVFAALLHDIGDVLAPENHAQLAASIIRPYVREEVTWIVEHHGVFQFYYYAHHLGGDRNAREAYRGHQWFDACARFCEDWDQASFDPDYPTQPLEHFEPLTRRMFSREPFDPAIVGALTDR